MKGQQKVEKHYELEEINNKIAFIFIINYMSIFYLLLFTSVEPLLTSAAALIVLKYIKLNKYVFVAKNS